MKLVRGKFEDMKRCPRCDAFAFGMMDILEKFGFNRQKVDGLQVYCKNCRNGLRKVAYSRVKRRREGEL